MRRRDLNRDLDKTFLVSPRYAGCITVPSCTHSGLLGQSHPCIEWWAFFVDSICWVYKLHRWLLPRVSGCGLKHWRPNQKVIRASPVSPWGQDPGSLWRRFWALEGEESELHLRHGLWAQPPAYEKADGCVIFPDSWSLFLRTLLIWFRLVKLQFSAEQCFRESTVPADGEYIFTQRLLWATSIHGLSSSGDQGVSRP